MGIPGSIPRFATATVLVPAVAQVAVKKVQVPATALCVDNTQTTWLPGTVLGRITASNLFVPSVQTATDGSQVPVALTAKEVNWTGYTAGQTQNTAIITKGWASGLGLTVDPSWGATHDLAVQAVRPYLKAALILSHTFAAYSNADGQLNSTRAESVTCVVTGKGLVNLVVDGVLVVYSGGETIALSPSDYTALSSIGFVL